MNYHNITYPDMNNGDGLRVVLWLSGCSHHCHKCQNPQTWNVDSGILFDKDAKEELFRELSRDYISGITFSGGDPLHENNVDDVLKLITEIKEKYPDKTIWLYTGFDFEFLKHSFEESKKMLQAHWKDVAFNRFRIISLCNILVDGKYINEQRDITLKWRGSKNQRVIDMQETLKQNKVILYCD
jgi:anaerobic ribonucleoside-triphosphate reductase activating protein